MRIEKTISNSLSYYDLVFPLAHCYRGVTRIFQRGGHSGSNNIVMAFPPRNIVGCLLKAPANEETLLRKHCFSLMFPRRENEWKEKQMFCFLAAQTGKHLLWTQNVSEKIQKHFLRLGRKFCVRNKCCVRAQTGKHLRPQHCFRNNVSSFAGTFTKRLTKGGSRASQDPP